MMAVLCAVDYMQIISKRLEHALNLHILERHQGKALEADSNNPS